MEEIKSTHAVPVFKFDFADTKKHPDVEVERLAVYVIPDTSYSYVLNIEDWKDYNGFVAWVPPDNLVDVTKPQFTFLAQQKLIKGKALIRAKNIRGVVSYGILAKVDKFEEDARETLGVEHYQPEESELGKDDDVKFHNESVKAPQGVENIGKYDVEAGLKYASKMFVEGEPVVVTQKCHGQNFRVFFDGENIHVGSRSLWKKEFLESSKLSVDDLVAKGVDKEKAEKIIEEKSKVKPSRSMWWQSFYNTPNLEKLVKATPNIIWFGEEVGSVKHYNYGFSKDKRQVLIFDARKLNGEWLNFSEMLKLCKEYGVQTVPIVSENTPYSLEAMLKFAEGECMLGNKILEGVVVCPIIDRSHSRLGRVKLKFINPKYLERG
jgi:RNA ligase (TIGR02306 family)